MRELESSLQHLGEFLLRARLVREQATPHVVRWVRRFLSGPASNESLADRSRQFCEELQRSGRHPDWQVRQAEHAIRLYFLSFLNRTDWKTASPEAPDSRGDTASARAIDLLRQRLRTRHYSYRTACRYVDWARRFFRYVESRQQAPEPTNPQALREVP